MTVATEAKKDAAREAWELLFRVAKAKHGVLSAQLAELDLTPVQAHALRRLDPEKPLAMSALAEALSSHAMGKRGDVLRHRADPGRLVLQPGEERRNGEVGHPGGGQLDRQRQPVQAVADLGHRGCVLVS